MTDHFFFDYYFHIDLFLDHIFRFLFAHTHKNLSLFFFTATIYHTPKTAKLFKKFSFFITKYDSVTIVNE